MDDTQIVLNTMICSHALHQGKIKKNYTKIKTKSKLMRKKKKKNMKDNTPLMCILSTIVHYLNFQSLKITLCVCT